MNKQYWEIVVENIPTEREYEILYAVPVGYHNLNITAVSMRNYIMQGYLNGQKVTGRRVVIEEE